MEDLHFEDKEETMRVLRSNDQESFELVRPLLRECHVSLTSLDLDTDFLTNLQKDLEVRVSLQKSALKSKQTYLKFQHSYLETQKSNQEKLKALSDECFSLESALSSLVQHKSALLHQKALVSSVLEEKKTLFYTALKKEDNTKGLLSSLSQRRLQIGNKKTQLVNTHTENHLQTIDQNIINTQHLLTPKAQKASIRVDQNSLASLTLILLFLIILHLIY